MSSPRFDIRVLGDKKLTKAMRKLPEKMERKVLRKAMRTAFKTTLERAKARVPVHSGALKRSLKLRSRRGGRRKIAYAIFSGGKDQLGVPSKTKSGRPRGYYPAAIEFGWKAGSRPVPERPWMRAALKESEAQVLAKLRRELWTGIRRIAAESKGAS
ncbi:MAG: HK97 gp10 family phage protein [Gemmatimonadota bacterium]